MKKLLLLLGLIVASCGEDESPSLRPNTNRPSVERVPDPQPQPGPAPARGGC